MIVNRYVRIVVILAMAAVMFSTVSAVTGIVAETRVTSGAQAPVCTAPCECMSESTAIKMWGVNGYEMCSKTLCGQSADAMVQYYCIHQTGSTVTAATTEPTQAPVTSAVTPAATTATAVTQKTPGALATVLAAIGASLLAAACMRRK